MSKFVITTRKNGEYQFDLQTGSGKIILRSEGYKVKASCLNGVESVRKNAPDSSRYDSQTAANGKFYFNLRAANGQIIGTGQMHESDSVRDGDIALVKANALMAIVEDQTA